MIVRFAGFPEGVFRLANSGGLRHRIRDVQFAFVLQHQDGAPVIGFVIEAIQKSVSGVIGRLEATSA